MTTEVKHSGQPEIVKSGAWLDRDKREFCGWIYECRCPSRSLVIDILIDRKVVATIIADNPITSDAVPLLSSYCGFIFRVPDHFFNDHRPHVIQINVPSLPLAFSSIEPYVLEPNYRTPATSATLNLQDFGVDVSILDGLNLSDIDTSKSHLYFLPPEEFCQPSTSYSGNRNRFGGLWMQNAFQPKIQNLIYFHHAIVDVRHGNVFDVYGRMWGGCNYFRDQDAQKNAAYRIINDIDSIPELQNEIGVICQTGMNNYYHWSLDILPAAALLSELKAHRDVVITVPKLNDWQSRSLSKISSFEQTDESLVRVPGAWVTGYIDGRSTAPDHGIVRSFEQIKARALNGIVPALPHRRLFISRKDTQQRVLINEDELFDNLSPYGFEKVLLSQLTYEDQIAVFSEASIVIGAHGAGLTNLGFCHKSASIIEICPEDYLNGCFRTLAVRFGIQHHWYVTSDVNPFKVDIGDFLRFLAQRCSLKA